MIRHPALRLVVPASFLAVAAAATLTLWPSPAVAHIDLLRSRPAAGAVLTQTPPLILLTFSGAVDPEGSTIVLLNTKGKRVKDVSAAEAVPGRSLQLQAEVGEGLAAGTYKIKWKALSFDGHTAAGVFSFKVKADEANDAEATAKPSSSASASASPSPVVTASRAPAGAKVDGGRGVWIVVVNVALLAGVIVGAVVFIRRRSRG